MLSKRSNQKEQMDNFELSGEALNKTLSGLAIINKYLGNTSATFKSVTTEIQKSNQALTIIDLGCGGGDNLNAIAKWCVSSKQSVNLIGIDGNANILTYANQQNNPSKTIQYLQADILATDFELPKCDLLISSHFMYHFSDIELISFLKKSKHRISTKIIFSELQRSLIAYILFKIGTSFLPFSKMIKHDGQLAIKKAFTKNELAAILDQAGFVAYTIRWKWVFRYLICISLK